MFEYVELFPRLLAYLAPSASLVAYAPFREQLLPIYQHFATQSIRTVIGMQVREIESRDYQVLPGRTHPAMRANALCGSIFSGIKVIPDMEVDLSERGFRGKRKAKLDNLEKRRKCDT